MKIDRHFRVGLVIGVLLLMRLSLFVIPEGSVGLLIRLGHLCQHQGHVVAYQPGLHLKWPWIDEVVVLDARMQSIELPSSRVLTEEQKSVDVDYFIKWRIHAFDRYFTRTAGNKAHASHVLVRKVNDLLRAHFGDRKLVDVISNERQDLMTVITKAANESASDIGVEVIDVRIKRVDYPKEVTVSVYERMNTQREQVAKMHRAQGEMKSSEIQAEADKEAQFIEAEAALQAALICADGDKEASEVANKAYAQSSEFYALWRGLRAHQKALRSQGVFVVDSSDFSKFFPSFSG